MLKQRRTLRTEIISRLFGEYSDIKLVVVENHDGFLMREDVRMLLSYSDIRIASGNSLDLRLWWENTVKDSIESGATRFIFVKTVDFRLADDIASQADQTQFAARILFPRYKWNVIVDCSIRQFEYLFDNPTRVPLSELQTRDVLNEYNSTYSATQEKVETILSEWRKLRQKINFNRPVDWMPDVAALIIRALEIDQYTSLAPDVAKLNNDFQNFLKQHYAAIVSSSIPPQNRAPRIVHHVSPFIAKQDDEKIALVVVDGMNFWQSLMLTKNLEANYDIDIKVDAMYSWLPSTTELSRQAIFLGGYPATSYIQNPSSEARLWIDFWKDRHFQPFQIYYEHNSELQLADGIRRAAFVTTALDEKMHSSDDYRYLYANTKIWVNEPEILESIGNLLQRGFKIYLTTDHGNIETVPSKTLTPQEKLNKERSMRHITLNPESNRSFFEHDRGDTVMQIDATSRTYYAVDNSTFSNDNVGVTHGGTHFLEVLIPFITITPKLCLTPIL